MDQTIICDKSLQERLEEYRELFQNQMLPVSEISTFWSYFLELAIDLNGWQAIWKIPRLTCEELKVPFPSYVLALVLDVEFSKLSAKVRVISVLNDIHIPEINYVPITELWPTKEQDPSVVLNIETTSLAIDTIRFFYNNLFLPWDTMDYEFYKQWEEDHLESRLRLYYDVKAGIIPTNMCDDFNSLISETHHLGKICERSNDNDEANEIYFRFLDIKNEMEKLENPTFRSILSKKYADEQVEKEQFEGVGLVITHDEYETRDLSSYLSEIESISTRVRLFTQINECFRFVMNGGTFVLAPGNHVIRSIARLGETGKLRGLNESILVSELKDVMLDFFGKHVVLENLTVDVRDCRVLGVVRAGTVTMINCRLIGDNSSTQQGLIVLRGASLELKRCEIHDIYTAIVVNSGSRLILDDCKVHDVGTGIKTFDDSSVTVTNGSFYDCKDYAICLETKKEMDERVIRGDYDLLNTWPKFDLKLVGGENNKKGNVLINNLSKIHAVKDLFEDKDLTIIEDENDAVEMRSANISPVTI